LVIGKITSIGSLIIIGAVAILFLNQARQTSFGHAGQDVGSGLSGISTGISSLFSSFINPITGLFSTIGNLFSFGLGEQPAQSQNTYGYIRPQPTPNTSRINSNIATQSTIRDASSFTIGTPSVSQSGYSSGAITSHRSTGGFGRAN